MLSFLRKVSPWNVAQTAEAATLNIDHYLGRLFIPMRTIVIQPCEITRQDRAYRVLETPQRTIDQAEQDSSHSASYSVLVEYLDLLPFDPSDRPRYGIGKVRTRLHFQVDRFPMHGVRNITILPVYPTGHCPSWSAHALEQKLIARGKQWASLCRQGTRLVRFTGTEVQLAFNWFRIPGKLSPAYSQVKLSAVVLDHEGYFTMNPQAKIPLGEHIKAAVGEILQEVRDEDLLLAPTMVYGYAVRKRRWMAYDVYGVFEPHPKDSAIHTDDNAPVVTGRDASVFEMVRRTHARMNDISKSVTGEDGQGLVLMLYGYTARRKARNVARAYEKEGRPVETFSASRLASESSERCLFRKAVDSNAVLVIHKDVLDTLLGRVMSLLHKPDRVALNALDSLKGENRKCIVLLVLSARDAELEQKLHAESNLSVHCVGLHTWLILGWWKELYYFVLTRVRSMV